MIKLVFFAVIHILLLSFSDRFRKTSSPMLAFLALNGLFSCFLQDSLIPLAASGIISLLAIIIFTRKLYILNPFFAAIMIMTLPTDSLIARACLMVSAACLLTAFHNREKYIVIPASAAGLAFLIRGTYYLPFWTVFPFAILFILYGFWLQKEKKAE
ncbi:MAG: hypothetical protein ACI4NM_11390 [Bullifex sp.]